ncbi:putative cold-shock DNA-binding protein [Saccharopolyspora spinosa]|uniref:Cold-shock DNA-binding protein n=1 Tax=Saccharopolyspora spinosa TaxID=60894 RepID=A0A2N3Y4Y8_SACSN|nr:putative cold-shock DNA-binding protein [Saccharopolyspora spinosa]
MQTGTIVKYDGIKGFGFIEPDIGGEDVFLHASILGEELKHVLRGGTRVQFEAAPGNQGTKAVAVRLLSVVSQTSVAQAAADDRKSSSDDELCEVLTPVEFTQNITDVLIGAVPDMTGGQILQVREQLVAFARRHGWVED